MSHGALLCHDLGRVEKIGITAFTMNRRIYVVSLHLPANAVHCERVQMIWADRLAVANGCQCGRSSCLISRVILRGIQSTPTLSCFGAPVFRCSAPVWRRLVRSSVSRHSFVFLRLTCAEAPSRFNQVTLCLSALLSVVRPSVYPSWYCGQRVTSSRCACFPSG